MTFDKTMDNKFEVEVKSDEKTKKASKKKKITCKSIIETFYNKEEKTFFSRTLKDWALLLIFFIFFYVFLFGYFALLLFIFIGGILTPNVPFRTGDNSLIGASSTINYRPVMDNTSSTLILSNNPANVTAFQNYVRFTRSYLESSIPASISPGIDCSDSFIQQNYNMPCVFALSQLGPCANSSAELTLGRVCLFLRINNIYGWLPSIINPNQTKDVLVSCSGVTAADNQNMGLIAYYPRSNVNNFGIFKNYYFPFLNKSPYWSPIVAVHFQNITNSTLVKFTCSASNVKNILPAISIQISLTRLPV